MDKKTILKLALGLLVAFQLNVCSAESFDEEMTLPVGAAFDLEMDEEIESMEYDAKIISMEKINKREVPVLKQSGDTLVTVYFKKENSAPVPIKFMLHSLPVARYDEVTDEHGEVKEEYQQLYDKKAYEARLKREANNPKKTAASKPASKTPDAKKPVTQTTAPKPASPVAKTPAPSKPTAPAPKTPAPKTPAVSNKPATSKPATPTVTSAASAQQVKAAYPENGTFSQQVLFLVNQERAVKNLPLLQLSDSIQRLSNIRAEEVSQYYSSTRPNGSHFSTIFGSNPPGCAQVIGSRHADSKNIFQYWMRNASSREILLDPALREMAVGHAYKENSAHKHYWAVLFKQGTVY